MFNQLRQLFWQLRKKWIYFFLSIAIASGIVVFTPSPGYSGSLFDIFIRGAQIIELSNISDEQEVELGKQINQELVSQRKVRILKNSSLNSYLNQVGRRLARSSTRPNIPYTFQVVNDKGINAFATMGGYVYINSGLMALADNEAELASVVAHEIGHIAERHALDRMKDAAISQGLLSVAGLETDQLVNIGVQLAFSLPNSREDEYEADQQGLKTLGKAGYAQSAMVSFMKKLLAQGGSAPTFLSTHPNTKDRIVALQEAIDPAEGSRGDGLNNQAYRNRIRAAL
jgi:beta-barrel assembly-enhancing protease